METARSRAQTSEGPAGHSAIIDYRKLSNRKLHEILSVVAPRMSSFVITDETRQTAIVMLEFAGTGQK